MNIQSVDRNNCICLMNSNQVWGGGEKWHYETACYLFEQGYKVLVITNRRSELYNRLKVHSGIKLVPSNISNISFLNPVKLIYFRNLLRRNNVFAIILGLSIDVKLGGVAAKLAGMDHIIYRRGSAVPVKNSIINRYLFHRVLTQVITNSREIRTNIFIRNPNIISAEKVEIIYNGVDLMQWPLPDFFSKPEGEREILVLGNAGRLVEQKGQEYLIQIASELKKQNVDFKLLIAGAGKLEKTLKKSCKRNKLENEIIFLDFINDISSFLKEIDIYLSTSLHEGSSHVLLEAMAAGKPLVAFNISSLPEIIIDGETGHLIPFGNIDLFTSKIVHLWKNKQELSRMGNNARKRVETDFDFYKNAEKVLELIYKR